MNLIIDIENASSCASVPDEKSFRRWVSAALTEQPTRLGKEVELSIRIVDEKEGAELNSRYRNKQGATNVLSFPANLPESLQLPLLGDLVICAPVVEREAKQQEKSADAHWAHMTIHGSLHLIGYDHIDDQDAEKMEQLETNIITNLHFPPPYEQSPGAISN